jgi:hypothetical protein
MMNNSSLSHPIMPECIYSLSFSLATTTLHHFLFSSSAISLLYIELQPIPYTHYTTTPQNPPQNSHSIQIILMQLLYKCVNIYVYIYQINLPINLIEKFIGDKYNSDGEKQIAEYIEFYHLKKGYMLTFNFNQNKKIGVNEVMYGDIIIVEAVV